MGTEWVLLGAELLVSMCAVRVYLVPLVALVMITGGVSSRQVLDLFAASHPQQLLSPAIHPKASCTALPVQLRLKGCGSAVRSIKRPACQSHCCCTPSPPRLRPLTCCPCTDEPHRCCALVAALAGFHCPPRPAADNSSVALLTSAQSYAVPAQMNRTGAVRLSRRFLDFTAHQDLQLTAGLDLDWPRAAKAAVGGGRSSSNKLKAVSVLAWQDVRLWGLTAV